MFSTPADLGIVAYGLVNSNGSTPDLNSGVKILHVNTGIFDIVLPGDPSQQEPLQEGQSDSPQRDIVLITPFDSGPVFWWIPSISPPNNFVRRVQFLSPALSAVDVSFSFVILRSLISPPQDAQGNYIAPA